MPRRGLSWVSRSLAIVLRDVGSLQVLIGGLMLVPALVGVLYQEWYAAAAFVAAAAVTAAVGYAARWTFEDAPEPKQRHAMVIAGGGWLAIAVFGALPFLLAAHWIPEAVASTYVPAGAPYASSLQYFTDPLHALFESMSGFTTTGLTMTVHEPTLPHALLFYRSFSQWIGGAGVLVLALAILRRSATVGGYTLYQSEARRRRVRPNIIETARSIARVYVALTLLVAAYLATFLFLLRPDYGVEPTLFDAVNHAMTGQATGGFSTLDDSIAGYGSYALEMVHIPPMVMGAIALPAYYAAFANRDPRELFKDPQVRTLFALLVVGAPTLAYLLTLGTFPMPSFAGDLWAFLGEIAGSQALREGVFQYASALTGTGWQTSVIGAWNPTAQLVLVLFAMNFGGCAGATTGGIKLVRVYLLGKGMWWHVSKAFLPENTVQTFRVGDRVLHLEEIDEELRRAGILTLAYFLFLALGTLAIMPATVGGAVSPSDVFYEVASAQGTVGLSVGLTGPTMSTFTEAMFVFLMWLGRLEIFPVLAFLRALGVGMDFR